MVGWATKHRGFKVDATVPGKTVTRIIGRTFLIMPDVSCQAGALVNKTGLPTKNLFDNVTFPEFFNGSLFLKTK